jgi:hypothetical protein
MPEQNVFQPDPKLSRSSYVSTFQQYEELYKESIENPEKFWGNIAKQFHWETSADAKNFMSYNFDISKGPISIKWMDGASTNICYNILDRNIKNGHGDKIAFYWYVWLFKVLNNFSISLSRSLAEQKREGKSFLCVLNYVGGSEKSFILVSIFFPSDFILTISTHVLFRTFSVKCCVITN